MESVYSQDNVPNPKVVTDEAIKEYTPPSITALIYAGNSSGSIKNKAKMMNWLDNSKDSKVMADGFIHITDRNGKWFRMADIARIVFGTKFRKSLNEKDVLRFTPKIALVRQKALDATIHDGKEDGGWSLDVVGRVGENEDNGGDTKATTKKSKLQKACDVGVDAMIAWHKLMNATESVLPQAIADNWKKTWKRINEADGPINHSSKGSEKNKSSARKRKRDDYPDEDEDGVDDDNGEDEDSCLSYNDPDSRIVEDQFMASVGKTRGSQSNAMSDVKVYTAKDIRDIIDGDGLYQEYYEDECNPDNVVAEVSEEFLSACEAIFQEADEPLEAKVVEPSDERIELLKEVVHSWELVENELGNVLHLKRKNSGKTSLLIRLFL